MRGEDRADRDPLLLAAERVAMGRSRSSARPSRSRVSSTRRRITLGGEAQRLHAVGEFVLDGVRDEVGERVLAHGADDIGEFARLVRAGVAAGDGDPAAQGAAGEVRDEARDRAQQGGLADTGRADQQAQFALGDPRSSPRKAAAAGELRVAVGLP